MKDATGELSMTAIAVVAIAAIGVVFTTLVWPAIKNNITRSTYCSQTISCDCTAGNTLCDCKYLDGEVEKDVKCPNQDVKAK